MCKGCDASTKYSPSKPEEPFLTIKEDDIWQLKPMEKIRTGIFYMENKKPHLCVVDKFRQLHNVETNYGRIYRLHGENTHGGVCHTRILQEIEDGQWPGFQKQVQ